MGRSKGTDLVRGATRGRKRSSAPPPARRGKSTRSAPRSRRGLAAFGLKAGSVSSFGAQRPPVAQVSFARLRPGFRRARAKRRGRDRCSTLKLLATASGLVAVDAASAGVRAGARVQARGTALVLSAARCRQQCRLRRDQGDARRETAPFRVVERRAGLRLERRVRELFGRAKIVVGRPFEPAGSEPFGGGPDEPVARRAPSCRSTRRTGCTWCRGGVPADRARAGSLQSRGSKQVRTARPPCSPRPAADRSATTPAECTSRGRLGAADRATDFGRNFRVRQLFGAQSRGSCSCLSPGSTLARPRDPPVRTAPCRCSIRELGGAGSRRLVAPLAAHSCRRPSSDRSKERKLRAGAVRLR
jgi:hypothetical protein